MREELRSNQGEAILGVLARLPRWDYVPPRKPLLRRPVKPTVSPRGLTTG
ncbi:MAG: hypothetical protein LN546_02415 [Rickettsia endosymbiont of Ecitomorpha arachnoides]|nr:hypothetical protein [Rickettsia endosymbiont of Ecitomorpha arachnoides]